MKDLSISRGPTVSVSNKPTNNKSMNRSNNKNIKSKKITFNNKNNVQPFKITNRPSDVKKDLVIKKILWQHNKVVIKKNFKKK